MRIASRDYPWILALLLLLPLGPATAGEAVFDDGFESGDIDAWSAGGPMRSDCNCYFSSDCPSAMFCNYGPGGFTTEDICTWVDNKPEGVPGNGCDIPHEGPWGGPICDGTCVAVAAGSQIGWNDQAVIEEGVRLWAEALLGPAEAGGGPPDPAFVEMAMGLGFESRPAAMNLGRQVNDVLILAGSPGFSEHFCHFEHHPDEPDPGTFVDLSGDACRASAARLAVEALLAEIAAPGAGGAIVDLIPVACGGQPLFGSRCPAGLEGRECVGRRIADTASFLMTPQGLAAWLARSGSGL